MMQNILKLDALAMVPASFLCTCLTAENESKAFTKSKHYVATTKYECVVYIILTLNEKSTTQ